MRVLMLWNDSKEYKRDGVSCECTYMSGVLVTYLIRDINISMSNLIKSFDYIKLTIFSSTKESCSTKLSNVGMINVRKRQLSI